MIKISLIKKLNKKLNYNQEMFCLSLIITFIFCITGIIFSETDIRISAMFIIAGTFCFGITTAYWIYNRNDDQAYGYKVRDKIRGYWKRFKDADY